MRGFSTRSGSLRRFLMGVAFALQAVSAWANLETPITSTADGNIPYMIVTEDPNGSSKRAPGIYAANETGEFRLVKAGRVLRGGPNTGLLRQFMLTRVSSRYESLAIVDGRLILFHINSDANDPNSVLEIGSAEHPVVDFLTRNSIGLPQIQSIQDIKIYSQVDIVGGGELLFVSIKQPSPFGSGMTVAALVSNVDHERPKLIRTSNAPIVIDYKFHESAEQLRGLVRKMPNGRDGVVSVNYLMSLVRNDHSKEAKSVQDWYSKLNVVAKTIEAGRPGGIDEQTPLIDPTNFQSALQTPPSTQVSSNTNSVSFEQIADKITHQYFIRFTAADGALIQNWGGRESVPGQIDQWAGNSETRARNTPLAVAFCARRSDTAGFVASLNGGELSYLRARSVDGVSLTKLESGVHKGVVDMAYVSYSVTLPNSEVNHYLFVSRRFADGTELTQAFVVHESRASIHFVKAIKVFNSFLNESQMADRTKVATEGGNLFFDSLTPPTSSRNAYRSQFKETHPVLDLQSTNGDDTPVYAFLKPVQVEQIGPKSSHYIYDDASLHERRTGLYYDGVNSARQFRAGELLGNSNSSRTSHVLLSKHLKLMMGDRQGGTGVMTVIALDPNFEGGKNGFQLVFVLSSSRVGPSADSASQAVVVFSEHFDKPFESISGLQTFAGTGKHSNEGTLIVAFDGRDGKPPATFSKSFVFNQSSESASSFVPRETALYALSSDEALTGPKLEQLISVARDGRVYFTKTPSIPPTDSKHTLVELVESKERRGSTEGLVLTSYSSLKLEDVSESEYFGAGSAKSSWVHMNEYGILDYLSQHNTYFNALNQKEEKERKEGKPIVERPQKQRMKGKGVFNGLAQKLDELVRPNTARKHIVLLVSERMQDRALQVILELLKRPRGPGIFWEAGPKFSPAFFKSGNASQQEVENNFSSIRHQMNSVGEMIPIIVDSRELLKAEVPQSETSELIYSITDHEEKDIRIPPHILYLLATEGGHVSPQEIAAGRALAPQVPQIILASPSDWAQLTEGLKSAHQEVVLDRFEIDRAFDISDLRLWDPESEFAKADIRAFRDINPTKAEENILPGVLSTARELADVNKPAKFKIILAPDELLPFMSRTLLTRWASLHGNADAETWSHKNSSLALHELSSVGFAVPGQNPPNLDQPALMNALKAMQDSPGRRSVVFGELSKIIEMGRIEAKRDENNFRVHDSMQDSNSDEGEIPNLIYLLNSGGRPLQPNELAKHLQGPRDYSVLLIGSKTQWEAIKRDSSFEQRFGLLNSFETHEVMIPSSQDRVELLDKVFESTQIRNMNFSFVLTRGVGGEPSASHEARLQVLKYVVNRAENLAKISGQDPITSFLRLHREFQRAIIEDTSLRTSKVMDRAFLERLLTRVFNIPLNLDILPPDDPLVLLSKENKAALALQNVGYEGPLELKLRIIRAILAQTKSDPVRPIPSSVIVYGDTSTGKTFLFQSLIKMLGLKYYDFADGANNDDAGAFILRCSKIVEKNNGESPDVISVDAAISHLNLFLSSPHGYRGFVLFDDLHKASPEVLKKLLAFINSLFEAPNGFLRVKAKTDEVREIPVKNLALFATVNPPQDQAKIRKFAPHETAEEMVIAALASDVNQVEISFVKRWGSIINLSQFPVEAKAPKLMDSVRVAGRDGFNGSGKFVIVSPESVRRLVGQFKDINAREFLAEATSRFLSIVPARQGSSLYIVIPRVADADLLKTLGGGPDGHAPGMRSGIGDTGRSDQAISDFVEKNNSVISIDQGSSGKVSLIETMVDSYRTTIYEIFANGVQADQRIAGDQEKLDHFLAPLLHALTTNMLERPSIPVNLLRLDPIDFGITTQIEKRKFMAMVDRSGREEQKFFPVKFADEIITIGELGELTGSSPERVESLGRIHVLTETSEKLVPILSRFMSAMARIENTTILPRSRTWIQNLQEADPKEEVKRVSADLATAYVEFVQAIQSSSLRESSTLMGERRLEPSPYDLARLFYIALDRAITRLPWARVSNLIVSSLKVATEDLDLGQAPGLQHYLFSSKLSLLAPKSHDLLMQIAAGSEAYKHWDQKGLAQEHAKNFPLRCQFIFSSNPTVEK